MKAFEPQVKRLALIPSDGGAFEVVVNGELVYSKLRSGRHVESGEVPRLIQDFLKKR